MGRRWSNDRLWRTWPRVFIERYDALLAKHSGIWCSFNADCWNHGGELASTSTVLFECEPRGALYSLEHPADVEAVRRLGLKLGADFHVGPGFIATSLAGECKRAEVERAWIPRVHCHQT